MKRSDELRHLTPRAIVAELDRYIVGQTGAKRALAIAVRNRWRRQRLPKSLREEVSPKNIIMVGPTGVGKTEIARRLARLTRAPFLKVEVTKFTEVGYVGRDVDSIVRDLVEVAARIVREELVAEVRDEAAARAEDRVLDHLLPPVDPGAASEGSAASGRSRERLRELLRAGKLDDREVEIAFEPGWPGDGGWPPGGFGGTADPMAAVRDLLSRGLSGGGPRRRKVTVRQALDRLREEEAAKLVDGERLSREAVARAETLGVVFLDEIDKICARDGGRAGEVSREGVQRDLLPLVEGTQVQTRHGLVRTDHILFVAAGAFHVSKVSDLIPELQGRFPIRVELSSLSEEDFIRILTETDASLLRQYAALLETEGVTVEFDEGAVHAMAAAAARANVELENIGARRLHTVLERVLEELSFEASELPGQTVRIDDAYVRARLDALFADRDLARHIL